MLNLLALKPEKQSQYLKYEKAFAESVGSRRARLAKLLGKAIAGPCTDVCDEVGLVYSTNSEENSCF